MNITDAYNEFQQSNEADGNATKTISWYQTMLAPFVEQFSSTATADITTKDLRAYIVALRRRPTRYSANSSRRPQEPGGLAEATINSHIRALHRFWNWASDEYNIDNPAKRIKRPSQKITAAPKTLDLNDFERMLRTLEPTVEGYRDHAILAFLADTGCRAAGLVGLTLDDIRLSDRVAVVTEKGDKRRRVRFSRYTQNALEQWLRHRPIADHRHVFVSLGLNAFGRALQYEGLYWALRRIAKRAGVSSPVNPHAFRHGFAKSYLENGGDLSTVSRLMGHSTLAITHDYYAIFNNRDLDDLHDKYSPLREIAKKG